MTQLFSPHADRKLRYAVSGVLALIAAAALFGLFRTVTGSAWGVGAEVEQPVPFSHRQHIDNTELACADCHAGVDSARSAGMPANSVCLACHDTLFRGTPSLHPLYEAAEAGRQLRWNAVSALPDFTRFHHGVHARAGAECRVCHGDVAAMERVAKAETLSMDFCVDCHRASQQGGKPGIRPVTGWRHDLTDCSVCHY